MMTHEQIMAHFLKWTINFIDSIPSENRTKSMLCLYSLDGSFNQKNERGFHLHSINAIQVNLQNFDGPQL